METRASLPRSLISLYCLLEATLALGYSQSLSEDSEPTGHWCTGWSESSRSARTCSYVWGEWGWAYTYRMLLDCCHRRDYKQQDSQSRTVVDPGSTRQTRLKSIPNGTNWIKKQAKYPLYYSYTPAPSGHMAFIQHRTDVDATWWRLYNVALTSMQSPDVYTATLYKRHVLAGLWLTKVIFCILYLRGINILSGEGIMPKLLACLLNLGLL